MAESKRKIPAVETKSRRKSVSPKKIIGAAIVKVIIRKIPGILLDLRVKFRYAKLIALRDEDKITDAPLIEVVRAHPSQLPAMCAG
jgi:hypothetical protein